MICTVNNIVETLCNPEGRFKTLAGIALLDPSAADPVYSYSGSLVIFRVRWNDRSYQLKCFLNHSSISDIAFRQISAHLLTVKNDYLVEYRYYGDEMLVFDQMDRPHYLDIILMEDEPGILLSNYLTDVCDRNDARALTTLLRNFCGLGKWLLNTDIVHGHLKPSNLLITPDHRIKIVNYERMQVGTMDDFPESIDDDNIPVANIALGLKVISSAPAVFRALNGNSIFRLPVLRTSLLPIFTEIAEKSGCVPMSEITSMLSNCNYTLRKRAELSRALDLLALDTTDVSLSISQIALARLYSGSTAPILKAVTEQSSSDIFSRYEWISGMSESLYCVSKDKKWGYVDREGNVIIPLEYTWAGDFQEGRASVELEDGCALIDKAGNFVLPAVYESLDWNSEAGLVFACLDGTCGVFDRDGNEVIPMIYDWISGTIDEGLILVQKDNRCGYIRPDGEIEINLIFDDAYCFEKNGTALVVKDGREYRIDTRGNEIQTIEPVPDQSGVISLLLTAEEV